MDTSFDRTVEQQPPTTELTRTQQQDRRFGREIAFGIQQTLACWATDFIDPYVSKWFQNRYGNKAHHVTAAHTWGGEIAGDSAAFFAYIGIKRLFQKPVDAVIGLFRRTADPLLEKLGHRAIATWADEHQVAKESVRYRQKLEEYKSFQAENVVDTAIVASAATGLNVAAQRYVFGNKQGLGIIFASKLIGATATISTMLGLRTALPTTMRHLDQELSDNYFAPIIRFTKKTFGVKDATPEIIQPPAPQGAEGTQPHVLTPEKRDGLLAMTAHHAAKINVDDEVAFTRSIEGQKKVYRALLESFAPEGYLVQVMEREHFEVIEKELRGRFDYQDPASIAEAKQASRIRLQADVGNKRRDIEEFLRLMDDAAFLAEVKQAVKSGQWPEQKNHVFTPQERGQLADGLLAEASQRGLDVLDRAEMEKLEYHAMMHALAPEGITARILASELIKRVPEEKPEALQGVAKDYMHYYQKEAEAMMLAFKTDSDVVQHAHAKETSISDKYQAGRASPTVSRVA